MPMLTLASLLKHPMKEYITNWSDHLSSFWVPVLVAIILLALAIEAIRKDRNIRMCVLYVVLMLCCVGYIACGDEVLNTLVNLWK